MKSLGLNLSPEDIYSINRSSMKDAVVMFSDYSTASVISSEGLLITSHNTALDFIQDHSSIVFTGLSYSVMVCILVSYMLFCQPAVIKGKGDDHGEFKR